MPQIVPAGQLNVASLGADDLYVSIVNPPSFIRGVPTDVFGVVGTASWGKTNTPIHLGSGQDAGQQFGPVSAASLTDPHDLATDLLLAFGQASSTSSIEGWAVRVTDGTDVAASANFTSTASAAETATIGGTITANDTLTITATSTGIAGSPVSVTYKVLSGDTTTTIATALAAQLNANANLVAANITAVAAAAVITIYYPTSLTVSWSESTSVGATETITLAVGTGSTAGLTVTAVSTGTLGNSIVVSFTAGAQTNTITATVTGFAGAVEVYPNLASTGFWRLFSNALAKGLSGFRGPSQWLVPSNAIAGVAAPTAGTSVTLTGGTDGRTGVTTGDLIGSDTVTPRTGIYAMRSLQPAIGVMWVTGLTDATAAPTIQQFVDSEAASALMALPEGVTTATAITDVQSAGIQDPAFAWVTDWIYFFDSINNQVRLVPPTAVIGGKICTLTPEQSPGNKPVQLVVGTVRNNPYSGNVPYTPSEVSQLEAVGVMFISNPIPAGNQFGIRHGQTTSNSPATQPFEYWRMTAYLARSFAAALGGFVDQLQSQRPDDPLRRQVRLELNNFLQGLAGAGQIDGFLVTCKLSTATNAVPGNGINTPSSIAQHYLYALCQVTYLSSVRFFILSLQGGTTVVTVGSQLAQQQV